MPAYIPIAADEWEFCWWCCCCIGDSCWRRSGDIWWDCWELVLIFGLWIRFSRSILSSPSKENSGSSFIWPIEATPEAKQFGSYKVGDDSQSYWNNFNSLCCFFIRKFRNVYNRLFHSYYVLILAVTAHLVKPDAIIIGQSKGNLICQAFQHYSSLSAIKHFSKFAFE